MRASLVARLLRRIGVDRAVGLTLIGRSWTVLSGAMTLFMLTRFLNRVQQGVYYTFNSVLALQVFFEMGLSFVILQFVSHERARLHWTPVRTLDGDPAAKARLASLLRASLFWYLAMASLMGAVLVPAGLIFFSSRSADLGFIVWQGPWIWVALVSSGMLALSPLLAVVEGCGLVAEVASVQMVQNVLTSLLLWVGLTEHWALYAAPFSTTFSLVYAVGWLWRTQGRFLLDLLKAHNSSATVHWKREVWPLQWKIALSWFSGYFVTSLFSPLLYHFRGPVEVGQLGMSFSIMGAIAALAMAWVTTKSAPFGSLIARREFTTLNALFFPTLWQSTAVVAIGGVSFWAAALGLRAVHYPLSLRLLPPIPLAVLVVTVVINHVVFAEALYLRAHKQEPFLLLSLAIGLLTGLSSFLLVRSFGVSGMMWGYFFVSAVVGLGGGTWIFVQKRRAWHPAPSESLL